MPTTGLLPGRGGERLLPHVRVGGRVERDGIRPGGRPVRRGRRSARCRRWWRPHLRRGRFVPADGVEQPGRVAAEPAQQRLTRGTFDGELGDAAAGVRRGSRKSMSKTRFAPEAAGAAGPGRNRRGMFSRNSTCPQRSGRNRSDTRARRRPAAGRRGRRHRCTGPAAPGGWARCRGARPVRRRPRRRRSLRPHRPTTTSARSTRWAPRQLHVVEDLEQLLRAGPGHPLDRPSTGSTAVSASGVAVSAEPGQQVPSGVQRPLASRTP